MHGLLDESGCYKEGDLEDLEGKAKNLLQPTI
jgi:hypothetical protein